MDIIAYFLGRTAGANEGSSNNSEAIDLLQFITNASQLFNKASNFPSKAVVNLTNATNIYQAFSHWNSTTEPIPIVEELIVNAPNVTVSNKQYCMGQLFYMNNGVKKVILNMSDESQYMEYTFSSCGILKELVLNFSTKNIISYSGAFANSQNLKKIVGVLDFSSATNASGFSQCSSLEEITFEPSTLSVSISLNNSSKLTRDSVNSIFNGLAILSTGTTQTLTLHKNTKILQSQVDNANAKGWTVAGGTVVTEEEYYG